MSVNALGLAVLRAAVLFALWLLLVDAVDTPNLVTGGVCAVLAAALGTRVQSLRTVSAKPRLGMLRFIYRPLLLLVSDSARVTWALVAHGLLGRPATGRFRAARYAAVREDSEDVAKRILTEWGASVGSNRYVIGIDSDQRLVLVHELVRSSGPIDPLELG